MWSATRRLAGADEDRTLSRLRGLRSDLIDPAIAAHHGRIVKRTGDGSLIEFRSVVDAVRCAIEVQNGLIERNAGVPPERRIDFRVGIHLGRRGRGERRRSDGRRRQYRRAAGRHLRSPARSVSPRTPIVRSRDGSISRSRDLGPTQLKNIADPVRVYSLEVGKPAMAKLVAEAKPHGKFPEPKWPSRLALLAAAIAALLIMIAAGAWYLLAANRPTNVASTAPRLLKPRIFPSSCCPSPISLAIRARTISPTALRKISPPICRASATAS